MSSAELLQKIFDREIARLNVASESEGLDAAGLRQLEMLVKAYSSFRDQRLGNSDPLSTSSTEDLLKELHNDNPTREPAAKTD
jgi:hypothetical protein